jgi:hypothetical protein
MTTMQTIEGWKLQGQIKEIRTLLAQGEITYDKAREKAEPIIEEMNRRGKFIADRFGRKFNKFNFSSLMR